MKDPPFQASDLERGISVSVGLRPQANVRGAHAPREETMLSLALAIPPTESSTEASDPAERFQQQVLAELSLAEFERQVQRLLSLIPPPSPPRPWRARRVRRARVRRASGGYPAL